MQTTEQTTQAGFTLIELLITVAIIALLAAIAVPNYNQYVERARRADATTGLTKIAAELERCYTQFSTYDNAGCSFGFVSNGAPRDVNPAALVAGIPSEEGDYTLTLVVAAQTYTLTAIPTADGRQARDDDCDSFTLSHLGQKGSTSTPVRAAGVDDPCW